MGRLLNSKIFLSLTIAFFVSGLVTTYLPLYRCSVITIFFLLISLGAKENKIFNPYYLFSLTPLSLAVYSNISEVYMGQLSESLWVMAIMNFLVFTFALKYTKSYNNELDFVGPITHKSLTVHTYLLLFLSVISQVIEGVSGSSFFLSSIISLCFAPAIACAFKLKNKITIFLVFAIVIVGSLSTMSKSTLLSFLIVLVLVVEKYYKAVLANRYKIVFGFLIGAILMVLSFNWAVKGRESSTSDEQVDYYVTNGLIDWSGVNSLFMPYMYFTTPWSNLQYVIDSNKENTNGLWLAKPMLGYLQLDDHFKSSYLMEARSSFNTFTYLGVAYRDFGLYLSVLTSLLLGVFVSKLYSIYVRSNSPLDVGAYAFVAQATMQMFFSNHFLMQSYPFTIVILMYLYKKLFFNHSIPQIDSYDK